MFARRARPAALLVAAMVAAAAGWYGPGPAIAQSQTDQPAPFDSSVIHDIEVAVDQDVYDEMVANFVATGEKDWIEATVTVDGTTYERVGLRLKGNSSLMGLRRGFPGGPGGSASAEEPEKLPWLIRFNKFVDDQEHHGHEYINIRSNPSQTALNEAVALDLLDEAGLMSMLVAETSFTFNGSDPVLRLGIQIPDDDAWQDRHFDCPSGLYKAESGGDWSYKGDDPDAYDGSFDQEGGRNTTDLTPLIELVRFINEADDATFYAELPDRLDVDAFATYLAMMDLLANWDDITGPGNNAYISYDTCTGQATIVPWDFNLSFGVWFGGSTGGGLFPPGGGFPGRSNPLVERFHADPELEALYEQKLTDLRASLYDSGRADEILDTWVDLLRTQATHLVDEATITQEADALRAYFRTDCVTATNDAHVAAGRASAFLFFVWAQGSDAFIGWTSQTTSLQEGPTGTWTPVSSC